MEEKEIETEMLFFLKLFGFHFILWCLVVNIKIAQAPDITLCCSSGLLGFFLSGSSWPFKSLRKQAPLCMSLLVFLSEIRQCIKASDLLQRRGRSSVKRGKKENHSWERLSLLSVISGVSGSCHGVSERFALFI